MMKTLQSDIEIKGFRAMVVAYGLMATSVFSLFVGPLAAYVIAEIKARDPEVDTWLVTHCRNIKEMFWLGTVAPSLVASMLWLSIGYKFFIADEPLTLGWQGVAFAVISTVVAGMLTLWSVYRFGKGVAALYDREPL